MTENDVVRQYKRFAYSIAADYYLPTGSRDDLHQEALIGLLQAARTHDARRSSFLTFAALCIRRRIRDAVREATRGKHLVLSESVREFDAEAVGADPADVVALRDEVQRLLAAIRAELSPLERGCLIGLVGGSSYRELDVVFGHGKSDNAVQRARVKLRAAA